MPSPVPPLSPTTEAGLLERWAASGAMALTGRPDGPALPPPDRLVPGLDAIAQDLPRHAQALGGALAVDPLARLVERAAIAGLRRGGDTSCGGATRLLRCGDAWVAVSLARPDDVDLLPAWLDVDADPGDPWPGVGRALADRSADDAVGAARLLGLPVALLPPGLPAAGRPPVVRVAAGPGRPVRPLHDLVVLDLGALWAGPLCGALLAEAGARVIKVESTTRPDGARLGPPAFFDRLNAGKEAVAVDLGSPDGVAVLQQLVAVADVVVESSRPRALEQLGLRALEQVGGAGPRVWASITAYGREGAAGTWVGFGDDAAVAGGLVVRDGEGPCFCVDAVADPATGMLAAAAILRALRSEEAVLLDLSMSATATSLAGPSLPHGGSLPDAALPMPPPAGPAGPALGANTAGVLADLGVGG